MSEKKVTVDYYIINNSVFIENTHIVNAEERFIQYSEVFSEKKGEKE